MFEKVKTSIQIKDDEIIIRKGKGNKPRMIPLDSSLGDLLSFHYYNMTDYDFLFPLTTVSVRNIDISISIIKRDFLG